MTIALLTSTMAGGGAQRALAKLAAGLADRGHEVDLLLGRAVGPYLDELPPQVRVVDLGARRMASAVFPLARYLRDVRPEAVFSALDYVNLVAIAARALARSDVPLVVSERNTLSSAVANSASLRTRYTPWLIRLAYPRADAVVAVSRGVADDLETTCRLEPGSVHVLNNPVVTPEVVRMRQEPVDHPWLLQRTRPVIVAAGRLTAQKGFGTLLLAFARVLAQRDARLVILGEGPSRSQLEELVASLGIGSHVSMPGFCANPYPAMAAADVFVLSSRWEGSPGALIEAMSCGTPVVATDCPSGPRELLDSGRHGRLVPVDDVEALAAALVDAVDGRVEPAPRHSWIEFEQDRVMNSYLDLLLPGAS